MYKRQVKTHKNLLNICKTTLDAVVIRNRHVKFKVCCRGDCFKESRFFLENSIDYFWGLSGIKVTQEYSGIRCTTRIFYER